MFNRPGSKQNLGVMRHSKPYCECWSKRGPLVWKQLNVCSCGEDNDESEWKWQEAAERSTSRVVVSDDQKQVTFHPFYSSGTAAVRGDMPFSHNHHYYWEVKMLTETYGTDIMVGVGTSKVSVSNSQFEFTSLLGQDSESYGLSYRGAVRHNAMTAQDCAGFCRGTIVGVMVDMWQGTLQFYINRKPQGISFYNLRRHQCLYPIVCSTAAQSSMRLIYASSWRASLLVDAAKTLAASVSADERLRIPPGIWYTLKSNFWMTYPNKGCVLDEDEDAPMEIEPAKTSTSMLTEILPSPYVNGYYVDSVEMNYRVVVYE
ncbi:SPRY domain-containing SOCS box protein 3-like [Achroia grisella]|uniref:SPRY domain-containing SOCS box protein 3-like n=1 Tax=Achroia grisella TaxID=688607 RepID=UPI0027D2B90C|nr:SPRY domain-containing SOCS box protein 3-like [Achroia grisella]